MKKFLVTILCFVYVAASSGTTINFHYCMGKFIGWDVHIASSATCSNCGMGKVQKKNCCNDKHVTIQLKKDQLASNINVVPANHFVFIQHQYSSFINCFLNIDNDIIPLTNSPSLIKRSAFLLNCNFRI